jgi:hypothetical protein
MSHERKIGKLRYFPYLQHGDVVEHLKSLLHKILIQFYNSRLLSFFFFRAVI